MIEDGFLIRPPEAAELPLLARIERRAARLFSPEDLPSALSEHTLPAGMLSDARDAGLLWVADSGGQPIGFALAQMLDGQLHLAEMDVDPSHARRGIGSALLRHTLAQAGLRACAAVTLTTFAHLPWNAPFYRRHGFLAFEPPAGSALADQLRAEAAAGLRNRVAMRRVIA
ncbi:GNAT family N-acetyltransferase [Chromobacterium violaceum]|uniref:GNAT family N-acetyltransferase n=1 Tax=Chromobacterium violaceum TaxID=536 RepID=UPI0005BE1FFA|nr:GNAT family N-acetyltransferase [Chromobacterium violaceum]MBT2865795.1 GNAT family N-acetyltransferase [Chromobacterium violaceum]